MIKYKITIEKVEEKSVIKSVYIDEAELQRAGEPMENGVVKGSRYRDVEQTETVRDKIYEQVTDNIDLKGIIDAFNSVAVNSSAGGGSGHGGGGNQ